MLDLISSGCDPGWCAFCRAFFDHASQQKIGELDGPSHCWLGRMMMYRASVAPTDITDAQPAIDTKG
jgi:hypothetical protein